MFDRIIEEKRKGHWKKRKKLKMKEEAKAAKAANAGEKEQKKRRRELTLCDIAKAQGSYIDQTIQSIRQP